jgi:hypothetical protein
MVIELKNVKTFTGHEGIGLNADVYVDGVKTFFMLDDASGGETDHQIINRDQYEKLKAYADAQPEYQLEFDGQKMEKEGKPWMCKVTIDDLFNKAYEKLEQVKLLKKLEKQTLTKLIWGNADYKGSYTEINFKQPLTQVAPATLQKYVDDVKAKLKPGQIFWNKNLESLSIKL